MTTFLKRGGDDLKKDNPKLNKIDVVVRLVLVTLGRGIDQTNCSLDWLKLLRVG